MKTNYEQADGKTDWDAYMAMRDDKVDVICKSCHWSFTRFGVYPGDPKITCSTCGKSKQPRYSSCFDCYKKSPEYATKQQDRQAMAKIEDREDAAHSALLQSTDCTHGCQQVEIVDIEDGQTNMLAKCGADELVRKHPAWFRLGNKPAPE